MIKGENSPIFLGDVKINGDSIVGNNGKITKKHPSKKEAGIFVLIGLAASILTIYSFFFSK